MHKIFFRKNFFDPKNLEKRDFWAKKSWKMAHLVSTPQRIILNKSLIAENFRNKFLKTMHKNSLFWKKNSTPKTSKTWFLGQKIMKNGSFDEHASTDIPTWVVDSLKFSQSNS